MITSALKKIKQKTRTRTRRRDFLKKSKVVTYIYRSDSLQILSMYVHEYIKKYQRVEIKPAGVVLTVYIRDEPLNRYKSDYIIEALMD